MNDLIEIRWHGRGGQGAKTASLLLADAAFNTGKYIQGFPEYGPERMGAPITAYNRISNNPITIHSNIYEPDYVVVVDDSLTKLEEVNPETDEVKAELDEALALRAEKAKAVTAADPKFALYYERLKLKRWPVVSALTDTGVCDGCHLQQPPSVAQLVQANAKNAVAGRPQSIVACTMCGRILYADL